MSMLVETLKGGAIRGWTVSIVTTPIPLDPRDLLTAGDFEAAGPSLSANRGQPRRSSGRMIDNGELNPGLAHLGSPRTLPPRATTIPLRS